MTATLNGATMTDTTRRDLPGGVTATIVTVNDLDGIETATQLTVPDEPLDSAALWELSEALRKLALDTQSVGA